MPGCGKNPVSQIVDLDGIWEGKCVDYITNSVEGHPSQCKDLAFLNSGVLYQLLVCPSAMAAAECSGTVDMLKTHYFPKLIQK